MNPAPPAYALVADDDDDWRELVASALRKADLTVLAAADGEQLMADFEALKARGETPAVVVSDVEMPLRGGLEVAASVRSASEDVPIVLLTGLRDPALPSMAESAGASVVLTKPIAPGTLGQRVRALISSRTPARTHPAPRRHRWRPSRRARAYRLAMR